MQKGFSSILILVVSFAMIAILGIGIWYYVQYSASQQAATDTQVPLPVPDTTTPTQSIPQTPQGWEQYTDSTSGITFAHPEEAQINEPIGGVSVTILGPTQTEGTELFDGLSLTLSTSPLNGRPLEEIAIEQQAESTAEPVVENVTQVQPTTYAGKQGYKYTVTSLGTRDIIFLPLAQDLYLKVINSTVDPTDQGFGQTAEQIVSTVRES